MKRYLSLSLSLGLTMIVAAAEQSPLGSADFLPSEECPVGRRGDGSGVYPGATPVTEWNIDKGTNVLWTTKILVGKRTQGSDIQDKAVRDGTKLSVNYSQPVVVGKRLFAAVGRHTLVCVDADNGEILWTRRPALTDAFDEEQKKLWQDQAARAELRTKTIDRYNEVILFDRFGKDLSPELKARVAAAKEQVNASPASRKEALFAVSDHLRSLNAVERACIPLNNGSFGANQQVPSPVTDGHHVIARFDRLVACYGLEGDLRWCVVTATNTLGRWGWRASPWLVDGKVILEGIEAIDVETGRVAWTAPGRLFPRTPLIITVDDEPLIVTQSGQVIKATDGSLVADSFFPNGGADIGGNGYENMAVSKDKAYIMNHSILEVSFPKGLAGGVQSRTVCDFKFGRAYRTALYHDGLLYVTDGITGPKNGRLLVFDPETGELLYNSRKPQDGEQKIVASSYYSPVMAGDYLFVGGLVFKPGPQPVELARNDLGSSIASGDWAKDRALSTSPYFQGERMWFLYNMKGANLLCCVGPKP